MIAGTTHERIEPVLEADHDAHRPHRHLGADVEVVGRRGLHQGHDLVVALGFIVPRGHRQGDGASGAERERTEESELLVDSVVDEVGCDLDEPGTGLAYATRDAEQFVVGTVEAGDGATAARLVVA